MKVLVVSNNFLSDSSNNGKTLKYLLSRYEESDLLWVYTTPLSTDKDCDVERIRLNMLGGISHIVPVRSGRGNQAAIDFSLGKKTFFLDLKSLVYKFPFLLSLLKLFREFLVGVKSRNSIDFIKKACREKRVERVVFVAGDYGFLHKLAVSVSAELSIPLCVYVTDDYIFDYSVGSVAALRKGFHNRYLAARFLKTMRVGSEFRFISNKMRSFYSEYFGVSGSLSFNGTRTSFDASEASWSGFDFARKIRIAYFGSLHTGRYEALVEFSKIVANFSEETGVLVEVLVYSDNRGGRVFPPCHEICNLVFVEPVYGGELSKAMLDSDILLVIESAKVCDLRKTWLSFSTKVMEYLYLQRPVIAFGPLENPSINELVSNGAALYLRDSSDLERILDSEYIGNLFLGMKRLREYLESENKLL